MRRTAPRSHEQSPGACLVQAPECAGVASAGIAADAQTFALAPAIHYPPGAVGAHIVAVLGTRYPDLSVEARVLGPDVTLRSSSGTTAEDILATADDADVLLAGSGPRFDAGVIAELTCRGIVRYGIGTDTIDVEAARAKGIWVARVSDYGTEAVAFHAVTLGMTGFRRVLAVDAHLRRGGWGFDDVRPLHLPSVSTAGVVGYGRIGQRATALLRALGFDVLVHDPWVSDDAAPLVDDLADLLSRSDLVTLHAPGRSDGTPLLGAEEFAAMRPGSVLVNTARGSLIAVDDLLDGLRAGRPAVAALDVFAEEPFDVTRFADVAHQVVLTPHMAWYSEESQLDLRVKASKEAARLLHGERPLDVVVDPTADADGRGIARSETGSTARS